MAEYQRNQVYRAKIFWEISDRICSVHLFYAGTAGPHSSGAGSGVLCLAIQNSVLPFFQAVQSNDVEFKGVYVTPEEPRNFPTATTHAVGVTGLLSGQSLPPNNAALVIERANELLSDITGKIYIPGIVEDHTSGQLLNISAAPVAWQQLLDGLIAQLTPSGGWVFFPAVRTTSTRMGASPALPKYYTKTSTNTRPLIAQMRKRNRRTPGLVSTG